MRINKRHTKEHAHTLACEQAHELVFRLAFFSCYSRKMVHPVVPCGHPVVVNKNELHSLRLSYMLPYTFNWKKLL